MTGGRVFVHVQHLLGVGHVKRAAAIVRAMVDAGLDVTVAQGGFDVPGIDFAGASVVRLPPARSSDAAFSAIVDGGGVPISDAWKTERAAALRTAFDASRPDVVMIELYPFGRRAFAFELDPLLDHIRTLSPRPWAVCSLRDILVKKTKPGRDAKIADAAERWFDRILVHGDPAFASLDDTFSQSARLAERIVYTGLVRDSGAPRLADGDGARIDEVVISGGGGAVAAPLFRAALVALPETPARDWTWRFLCGPNMADADIDALRAAAPANAVFEPNRPDFADLLACAGLSVSQAGYNTALDVLGAGVPAVFVPFAEAGESEQTLRAERLAAIGAADWTNGAPIDPTALAQAVHRVLGRTRTRSPRPRLDLNGAAATAEIVVGLIGRHPD